ncbi:putative fumipyrrole biosynthesis protein C [Elsinoe australis]|uniref:Putative fumipyrrole biosynthesis protein C n=1 Tax=Elsinoe australis TaxID=40998 RepID=A0A4U7BBP1_9PEZI|nr:putative fumipyrrole biosynthesis protein C [Elsinoe australis]
MEQQYDIRVSSSHGGSNTVRCHMHIHTPKQEGSLFRLVSLRLSRMTFSMGDMKVAECHFQYTGADKCDEWPLSSIASNGLRNAFQSVVSKLSQKDSICNTALGLLIPATNGYMLRNDLLQKRFQSCRLPVTILDFTRPRQAVTGFSQEKPWISIEILESAIGAFIPTSDLSGTVEDSTRFFELLNEEIGGRLSHSVILPQPLPRLCLALVEGRPHPDVSDACKGPLAAAAALGIDLVVLDSQDHWLCSSDHRSKIKQFIECDLNVDDALPNRIVEAVHKSGQDVHGIITFADRYLDATAKASAALGKLTYPPESIAICTDKSKTRAVAASDGAKHVVLNGMIDKVCVVGSTFSETDYPLIIKPTRGHSSEGVSLAWNEDGVYDQISKLKSISPDRPLIIEPYIDGPEVDANFVMIDGEVIFSEINDDFPSSAESSGTTDTPSFAEVSTILPSKLPAEELVMLRSDLADMLRDIGFSNGVFHVEARVQNSRVAYTTKGDDLDLRETKRQTTEDPRTFLVEINARTPGHQESFAVDAMYGIDYYALYMLLAAQRACMRESDRAVLEAAIRALAVPVEPSHQYGTHLVFVSATHGGIFKRAELLPTDVNMVWWRTMLQEGDIMEDPKISHKWPFVACFVVQATTLGEKGREEVKRMGQLIRQNFRYDIS